MTGCRPKSGQSLWSFRVRRLWREWGRAILIAALLTGTVRSAIADWHDVPTGSMIPTILPGDRIFVNKLAYDLRVPFTSIEIATWEGPQRGDVVILYSPADGTRLVKRVVGVPGDRVAWRGSRLFVNGTPCRYEALRNDGLLEIEATERATHEVATEWLSGREHLMMTSRRGPRAPEFGPVTVPQGAYFVMGDNRDDSFDSRGFGFVGADLIQGRVEGIAFSLDREHAWSPRWKRFFSGLK